MTLLASASDEDIPGMTKVFIPMADCDGLDPIIDWCNERFEWDDEWCWGYADDTSYQYNALFYFANPKHATLFALTWS
jgi:hypothetical protein